MMRLWLRSEEGGDVPLPRALLRSFLQLGWLLPGSLALAFGYTTNPAGTPLQIVAIGWGALSLLGSFTALTRLRQTIHDRLTRTRVLVAVG
jgi:uncharacterized RDD family membrane protein YckC